MADLDDTGLPLVLRLRLERGLSVAEVERETGVNHKTITAWEEGSQRGRPGAAQLKALADFYGVSPATLWADFARLRELRNAA